ncbi:helix-turn-helix domain-containing protein [Carnobacterium pleistocenium]|uniref:helix-turn-helix domain-containing protein n=1 Tax=Carnobacterium pleistocenium TaxID=181073 RepID=UPI0005552ACB|nr:helix-turn-helix domain-containing protein [Carnobacterium pleistocenium]
MLWEVIEKEINKKQISIYQLTKKAGLSVNCLYHLKSGRTKDMSFLNMCSIAEVLNVSLDTFNIKKGGNDE